MGSQSNVVGKVVLFKLERFCLKRMNGTITIIIVSQSVETRDDDDWFLRHDNFDGKSHQAKVDKQRYKNIRQRKRERE